MLLAQELVLELDRKLRHPNVILKIDIKKAYDRVNWEFLKNMLCAFGFQEVIVDLIFGLISNIWFSVLIHREPSGFFVSRGPVISHIIPFCC